MPRSMSPAISTPASGRQHRAVAGRVRVVRVDDGARSGPVDLAAEQRPDPGKQRQVVPRGRLPDAADEPGQLPAATATARGVAYLGNVAERGRPEQMIPVRVGGPARHRAQAALRQPARERGQVGDGHRRVDEQAAAVGAGDDRRRRGVQCPPSRRRRRGRSHPAVSAPGANRASTPVRRRARRRCRLMPGGSRSSPPKKTASASVGGGRPDRVGQPPGIPRADGRYQVAARRQRLDQDADDGPGGARVERLDDQREHQADRPESR